MGRTRMEHKPEYIQDSNAVLDNNDDSDHTSSSSVLFFLLRFLTGNHHFERDLASRFRFQAALPLTRS